MIYKIVVTEKFEKSFKKIDKYSQKLIKAWIEKNLVGTTNPRLHGKGLTANKAGQWRYRINDFRILAEINDAEITLLLVNVGHRKEIYKL